MKLKPSLSLPSLGRLLKDRLLYPPPGWPPQLSRACTLKTTGLEKVRGFFISLLLGHFNHSDTRSGPFMEKKKSSLYLWGLCCFSSLGCRGAFISRVFVVRDTAAWLLSGSCAFVGCAWSQPWSLHLETELWKEAIGFLKECICTYWGS